MPNYSGDFYFKSNHRFLMSPKILPLRGRLYSAPMQTPIVPPTKANYLQVIPTRYFGFLVTGSIPARLDAMLHVLVAVGSLTA